jgi:hypothetical protein
MTAQFVADALMLPVWSRGKSDAVMHHSNRGSHQQAIAALHDRPWHTAA